MATVAASHPPSAGPRPSPIAAAHDSPGSGSGDQDGASTTHSATAAPGTKKSRPKKNADPINTSKQIEDTIAQLERSKAVDKDQELEIGGFYLAH